MASIAIVRAFLAARGIPSLAAWARRARIKPGVIDMARYGRGLSAANARKLARAVGEDETIVRALLTPGDA